MRCISSRWRFVCGMSAGGSSSTMSTSPGGGGMGVHSSASRMNLPRSVGEPSFWFANCERNPALPRMPDARAVRGQRATWKVVESRPVASSP